MFLHYFLADNTHFLALTFLLTEFFGLQNSDLVAAVPKSVHILFVFFIVGQCHPLNMNVVDNVPHQMICIIASL